LAEVPCPLRLWPRRRGGAAGSRWGALFFPRVLIAFIRLKGRTRHHAGRGGLVQVALNTLPEGMELLTR
jgi:hypothetical protein